MNVCLLLGIAGQTLMGLSLEGGTRKLAKSHLEQKRYI